METSFLFLELALKSEASANFLSILQIVCGLCNTLPQIERDLNQRENSQNLKIIT